MTSVLFNLTLIVYGFSQNKLPDFVPLYGSPSITIGKISGITQDGYGYMWFADQGRRSLLRYDGYNWKEYKHNPLDSNTIGTNQLECIAHDPQGNIWIPTSYGLDKFDLRSGIFTHHRIGISMMADAFLISRNGLIYSGSNKLIQWNPATGQYKVYQHDPKDPYSLDSNMIRSLYEDREGTIWLGTGFEFDVHSNKGSLCKFDPSTGKFTKYVHDPKDPNSISGYKPRSIYEDYKGNLWVGTETSDGLQILDRKTGKFDHFPYDKNKPNHLARPPMYKSDPRDHISFINGDPSGRIYIGTYGSGLTIYDPNIEKTTTFTHEDNSTRKYGLQEDEMWVSYTSRENVLYIGPENNHIYKVDPFQMGFYGERLKYGVSAFYEDDMPDRYYLSTNAGLVIKDGNHYRQYQTNKKDPTTITDNVVTTIRKVGDGVMEVGTFNGLNIFYPDKGIFKRSFYNPDHTTVALTIEDTIVFSKANYFGNTFFCTRFGLYITDKYGKTQLIRHNDADSLSISDDRIVYILPIDSLHYWFSSWDFTNGAVELFDLQTKKCIHYLKGVIPSDLVRTKDGGAWVSTSQGLYTWSRKDSNWIQAVDKNSALYNIKVESFKEHPDGNLWGTCLAGIFRYNLRTGENNIFDSKFGVEDVIAWLPYVNTYVNHKNNIMAGNYHGYYEWNPEMVFNKTKPCIVITDFKINDSIFPVAINEANQLKLNYNQNWLSFSVNAIHLSEPEKNQMQYRLDGFEKFWHDAQIEKKANYFNIPSGNYTLRLHAVSSYGIISDKKITIHLALPWWKTNLAYFGYVAGLILSVGGFTRWRTKNLLNQNLVLEKKVAQRTSELQNEKNKVESTLTQLQATQTQLIHSEKMASLGELTAGIAHEIQNPLNFVNNFSALSQDLVIELNEEIDKGNTSDIKSIGNVLRLNLEKIQNHGQRAANIVSNMLDHSRASSGEKRMIDLYSLCDEYLRLSYHGMRVKHKDFNAAFELIKDTGKTQVYASPQDLGRVLLNIFNNAFYACKDRSLSTINKKKNQSTDDSKPEVRVWITHSDEGMQHWIRIHIQDNGSGIPTEIQDKIFQPFFTTKPTGEGTGLGLSLSYDIITKGYGGKLEVSSSVEQPSFTEFVISLPVDK